MVRLLAVLPVAFAACILSPGQAYANLEEVTFATPTGPEHIQSGETPPGGPVPILITGDFFFNTSTVSGGLQSGFNWSQPPGDPGTANVTFAPGLVGEIVSTYSDGSVLTRPFSSGFALHNLFDACGSPFPDCVWAVGQALTQNQFQSVLDPWALILNGLRGESDEFFSVLPALPPGSGEWDVATVVDFQVHAVPTPPLLTLFGGALVALGIARLRRTLLVAS